MIQISETAARKIRTLMAKQGIDEGGLRVGVKGGGCSGLSYTFAWERKPRLGDEVYEGSDGAKLFVDRKSLLYLDGTVLDYDTSLISKGFVFNNPNAKTTCGCGSSFGRIEKCDVSLLSTIPTVQICRTCGGGAPVDVHFCPQCTKILTLARQGDYFSFLGVPRKLNLDVADLEQRFRALSRQFHPDYFYNATPAERRASLERSSYLNDAYRTLRQPIPRVEYLLSVEGMDRRRSERGDAAAEPDNKVPPALLEEVFALNEELDAVRELRSSGAPADEWKGRLQTAREPIERKRSEHEAQLEALFAKWDDVVDRGAGEDDRRQVLHALRERMLERNYIQNLLAGIERELAQ